MQLDTPVTRALTIGVIGLVAMWAGLHRLDIDVTGRLLARYLLIPAGAVCAVGALWHLIAEYVEKD